MGFDIFGLSFGRSISNAQQSSESSSQASSQTRQNIFLADLFSQLYGGAYDAAKGIDTGAISKAANSLFESGAGFVDKLDAAGAPGFAVSPVTARGVSPISAPGSTVDEQIGMLASDLGRFYREELQPAIASEAVGAYSLGGGRQGVAEGRAADSVIQELGRGSIDIRNSDIDRRLAVAVQNQNTALAGSGLALEADKFSSELAANYDLSSRGIAASSAEAGISSLGPLLDILSGGESAGLSPYLLLSQLLQPTVLTQQDSSSESSSTAQGSSSSRAFQFGLSGQ